MRRHSENSSNFIDLELACFEELRLFRRDADGRVLHALFQNGDLSAVGAAAKLGLPRIPDALRVFDSTGVLQHTTRCRAVGEELRAIFLGGNGKADCVLRHGDGAVADQAVKAKAGNMQHIGGL